MADLTFDYKKSEDFEQAYANVKNYITPENIKKFKVKAEINYDKKNKKMIATGKGFTLTVLFDDSKVDLNLKLSFILKPIRKTVLNQMEKEFSKLV